MLLTSLAILPWKSQNGPTEFGPLSDTFVGLGYSPVDKDVRKAVVRAAEYVRMSTDHQRYSTENQADAIRQYASFRGFEIVRTYADEGKSGLQLAGRDALQQLIDDVTTGKANFKAILVYDISRWGRFQDPDEAGHLEHICKRAGVSVHYCKEPFENDGSPIASIFKNIKRSMAGEYSRELSTKVFAGQRRLIELGFRQGGPAGFGLRRVLRDQTGAEKGALERGQHKSIQTDRVVLAPGPDREVVLVREIYRAFVIEGRSERQISSDLNDRAIPTDLGRSWTRGAIHQILINEKYIGNNVWNRTSFKLKKERVRNDPATWIRADSSFPAIVDTHLFEAARSIIQARSFRLSNDEMLGALRSLFQAQGLLSGLIIDEADDMPSSSSYRSRFGSLLRAYAMVGYSPRRDYRYIEINRALRRLHPEVLSDIESKLMSVSQIARRPDNDLLEVNGEFSVSVVIVRCQQTRAGAYRWRIRLDTGLNPDVTAAVRMDAANHRPLDFYLFPRIDLASTRIRLAEENELELDAYRFESLEPLYGLAERSSVLEAA
jgi:DNA invertase Pin-like site-specific DNA recombinase